MGDGTSLGKNKATASRLTRTEGRIRAFAQKKTQPVACLF